MEVDVILPSKWINEKTGRAGGNTLGYASGAKAARKALEKVGVSVVEGSKLRLHYTSPHFFEPVPGMCDILFTMWEAEDLPKEMVEFIAQADYVIVPSKNSKDCIKKAGIPVTVYVCHQGIDTEFWEYRMRHYKYPVPQAVRYLWVGAPNVRKGYDLAVRAFHHAFHATEANVELYIKSSFFKREGEVTELPRHRAVIDTRNLSLEGLRDLYWSAHVFFFPSRGEGAGLPPLEAMCTGMPVIAPPYTGMKDYMLPEHSYPVKYHLSQAHYGIDTKLCECDMDDLVEKLRHTHKNLPEAMRKGMKASDFVKERFSLESMGFRLKEIFEKIERKENG